MTSPQPFVLGLGPGRILLSGRRGTVTAAEVPAAALEFLAGARGNLQEQIDQLAGGSSNGGGGGEGGEGGGGDIQPFTPSIRFSSFYEAPQDPDPSVMYGFREDEWPPMLTDSEGGWSPMVTYSRRFGRSTRIGRTVFWTLDLEWSDSPLVGSANIGGLPWEASDEQGRSAGTVAVATIPGHPGVVGASTGSGSTSIRLSIVRPDGSAGPLPLTESGTIVASGMYRIN